MKSRISFKLIAAVGITATVTIGLFSYLILESYERRIISDLETYAHQITETVKSSTRYDMMLNRRESLHQIIGTIGRQESIEKVRIFNKEGEIIFSTDSVDIGTLVDKRAEACYACHAADQPLESVPVSSRTRVFANGDHERTFGIISPIYNERSCWESSCHAHTPEQKVLGVLDITMPLTAVDEEQRANRQQLFVLTVLLIALVSLLIYWLTGRLVLRPVNKLIQATQRVASGDLEHEIAVEQKDEIGRLAESFNDMTRKLAEAQRQLFQADKLASVGRLAAGVAHEINNPLTGVLTYSSFLLSRAGKDAELRSDLEVIVRETKRCREIVKGLLDFARQSAPEKRLAHPHDIIKQASAIVQNQLSIQKAHIELHLADEMPEIRADVNQLEQVLVNLFVNAGDAMLDRGGVITVRTSSRPSDDEYESGAVTITVSDTGAGIPKSHLDKIFDPFFTTKGQKGNGLGLAI
ncbi:MAG TPA: HAMP domain-containing protein, partial [Rhodothermia bacterium]|nr:HAMP domain-containing protein [Rhodothermia bacterium]